MYKVHPPSAAVSTAYYANTCTDVGQQRGYACATTSRRTQSASQACRPDRPPWPVRAGWTSHHRGSDRRLLVSSAAGGTPGPSRRTRATALFYALHLQRAFASTPRRLFASHVRISATLYASLTKLTFLAGNPHKPSLKNPWDGKGAQPFACAGSYKPVHFSAILLSNTPNSE